MPPTLRFDNPDAPLDAEDLDAERAECLARIDAILEQFEPAALKGDVKAGRVVVEALDLRARLLGLYD